MTENDRGTDRAGRRSKRFLSPSQKYEIWLQLVRQEVTIAEAAAAQHVDRSTIMRIRTVAKEGASGGAAGVHARCGREGAGLRAGAGQGRGRPAVRGAEGDGGQADADRGKRSLGLSGWVRSRAVSRQPPSPGCSTYSSRPSRSAGRRGGRATRWSSRRGGPTGGSDVASTAPWPTRHPGGRRCTACCPRRPRRSWRCSTRGETDRSHRKLAHRGSYLGRFWVSPSRPQHVLFLADRHFRPLPRPEWSVRRQFPDWVEYKPNSIWIYDTTHFTRAGMAVLLIEDLLSRKCITEIVSSEGNLDPGRARVHRRPRTRRAARCRGGPPRRRPGRPVRRRRDTPDPPRRVQLNGPQMTSGSTRGFMALCAIAQHFGRPGTPTDQAWIRT